MTEQQSSDSSASASEQQAKEPDTTSKPESTADSAPAEQSGGKGGTITAVIAMVIAVAAIGLSGYLWYQVKVEQKTSQYQSLTDVRGEVTAAMNSIAAVEKSVEAVDKRVGDFRGDYDALNQRVRDDYDVLNQKVQSIVTENVQALASAQEKLENQNKSLVSSVEKVYEDMDRSLDSWALEEIEQLLRIANHSLRLNADVMTATRGLELADARIQELANPALLEVREQVLADLNALENIEPADIPGLTLKLSQMAATVDGLPMVEKTRRDISDGEGAANASYEGSWSAVSTEILDDLKQLVRIRNAEQPAKPLLTPDQRYFLQNNLRLMLSGAQLAALRRDTATYRDNLTNASEWLATYFEQEHEGVSTLLEGLGEMVQVELNPELPDISQSLVSLQDAKSRMKAE